MQIFLVFALPSKSKNNYKSQTRLNCVNENRNKKVIIIGGQQMEFQRGQQTESLPRVKENLFMPLTQSYTESFPMKLYISLISALSDCVETQPIQKGNGNAQLLI